MAARLTLEQVGEHRWRLSVMGDDGRLLAVEGDHERMSRLAWRVARVLPRWGQKRASARSGVLRRTPLAEIEEDEEKAG